MQTPGEWSLPGQSFLIATRKAAQQSLTFIPSFLLETGFQFGNV